MNKQAAIAVLSVLLLASIAFGQQEYVGRFDVFTGFTDLSTSKLNLGQPGFHTQIGTNPTNWYSMGFDFSDGSGDTSLIPTMAKASLQKEITTQLAPLIQAGLLPATYQLKVPLSATSQTYAMGPQLNFRHFKRVTLFIHPDLGAIHETAMVHPQDMIATAVAAQLAPSGHLSDWTWFFGVGGGMDLKLTTHLGLRVHADYVRDHLFSNMLDWQGTFRISVGPTVHFGKNMAQVR